LWKQRHVQGKIGKLLEAWTKWYKAYADKIEFYNSLVERGAIKEEDRVPDISPFAWIVHAFFDLNTCANHNGIIPWNIIHEYAEIKRIEDFDTFLHCIRVIETTLREDKDGRKE
jgi:hypothetical protein